MAELVVDVGLKGIISAYVDADFDEGKKILEREGFHIITLEENAKLRLQEGIKSDVCESVSWNSLALLCIPDGYFLNSFFTKNSPIMANPKQAVESHKKMVEFDLTDEQVDWALADSIKVSQTTISTERLGEYDATAYAFGKEAKRYGEFLREAGILDLRIRLSHREKYPRPFIKPIVLFGLSGNWDFTLICCDWLSNKSIGMRGVLNSDKYPMQEDFEAYTPAQISRTLERLKYSGLEGQLLTELRKRYH